MGYTPKDNSGALFKNTRKEQDDNRPDYTGDALVDGARKLISAWLKTSKKGDKYLSLAFRDDAEGASKGRERAAPATHNDPLDDDLPF